MAHETPESTAASSLLPRKRALSEVESALIMSIKKRKVNPQAHLLGLPRELRDLIWEFALQETGRVHINPHFRIPTLLSTNRQIRTETKPVFLYSNKFWVEVTDCDASLLRNFRKYIDEYINNEHYVHHGIMLDGGPDWKNLKAWCRAIWEGEDVDCSRNEADTRPRAGIVCAATQIARESWREELSWASCLRLLLQVRDVAGLLEPAWVVGGVDEDWKEIEEEDRKAKEVKEESGRWDDFYSDEFSV